MTKIIEIPSVSEVAKIIDELGELALLIEEHGIVRDRMQGTGVLTREEAHALSLLGYVGRASNFSCDVRRYFPYNRFEADFAEIIETSGDVMARFLVRRREAQASLRLILQYIDFIRSELDNGEGESRGVSIGRSGSAKAASRIGVSLVEGWRGATCYFVEVDADDRIRSIKISDPSMNNWMALPPALHNAIVPDFPLINKSFNQSYAGNDL